MCFAQVEKQRYYQYYSQEIAQKEHRLGCSNEQCIAAFRIHGLWSGRPGTDAKNSRNMQTVASSGGLNVHAAEFIPNGTSKVESVMEIACLNERSVIGKSAQRASGGWPSGDRSTQTSTDQRDNNQTVEK